ncbi:beta-ribofuranosylaminobenzene 5'-phosphate synthase family protein [Moorella sulfitireducens (nom. illeg.)]|uniref:beta-ribofuranosylaminobenzene 5'-phosphate synthase family protein n=1 Tax=Neomoorella sulfitireducens TaxID=2972948 RepID=UPI0021ACE97B|nr:beta-ribofuranosylaminobenzene 5'-phosphate synthase family protein [Moorella sulfitireducens]
MPTFWVRTGARLHLGQLDLNGSLGRLYGGIGLAIDRPQLEIAVEKASRLKVEGPESETKRVIGIASQYLQRYRLPGASIRILQSLPAHCGLGSGTQLSLAIGVALTRVYGLEPSLLELAQVTDREGSRSGIGVAVFEGGGFVVDGGRPVAQGKGQGGGPYVVPPVIARHPFPREWGIVLAIPRTQEKMAGSKEEEAFSSLPPMEAGLAGRVARIVLMQLLPALVEKNLYLFGQAVTEIQKQVGNYFSPVQGGVFATREGAEVAEYLLSLGAAGVGQSSWGPAVYGFVEGERLSFLVEATRKFLGERGRVLGARGINHGAAWGWNETGATGQQVPEMRSTGTL